LTASIVRIFHCARPALDGVLPANGIGNKPELLEIDQAMNVVAARERGAGALLVLIDTSAEIARHAGVERAVLAARQNVDVSALGHAACDRLTENFAIVVMAVLVTAIQSQGPPARRG
jgi:hypothetical protein